MRKLWISQKFLPLYLLMALCLPLKPLLAEELPLVSTITVTGEGRVEEVPDQAEMSFTINTKNKVLTQAKNENDEKLAKMLAAVKELKIEEKHIMMSNISISPHYRWVNETRKQVFEAYNVNRSLRITLVKLEDYEQLLTRLIDSGVDQVHAIQFDFKNARKLKEEALTKAVKHAASRAQIIADAAGVSLGKPMNISIRGATPPPMPVMHSRAMMAADSEGGSSHAETLPGLKAVSEQVTVVYHVQ